MRRVAANRPGPAPRAFSTTHALVGAVVGAGLAGPGEVQFAALGKLLLYPLLVGPVIAAVLGALVYLILRASDRPPTLDALPFLSAGARRARAGRLRPSLSPRRRSNGST